MLEFFRQTFIRRKLNVDRKHSITTVKVLLESATTAGFRNFSKNLLASLTDEGIKLTLEQFQRGFFYKVDGLYNTSDIERCLNLTGTKRGPSAARFRCLVSDQYDSGEKTFIAGNYYSVTSRSANGSVDMVYINFSGNIACTSPSYARWGIPSKHIWAVFIDGSICINMKQHFNPVYHLPFMNDIAEETMADYSVTSDVPNDSVSLTDQSTYWNWAQKTSEEVWEKDGLGGEAFNSVAHPSAKSISHAPESLAEKTKKALHFIAPYINNCVEERQIFYLYYEGLLRR